MAVVVEVINQAGIDATVLAAAGITIEVAQPAQVAEVVIAGPQGPRGIPVIILGPNDSVPAGLPNPTIIFRTQA